MGAQALAVLLLSIAASACGFFRELATAAVYATSARADAFSLALLYADGVSAVMTYGIASQVLVPLFVALGSDQERAQEHLLSGLFVWVTGLGLPISLVCLWRPDVAAALVAPGFSEAQAAALRPMVMAGVPTCMLLAAAGIASAALRARSDFYTPVIGRALFSLVTAIVVLMLGAKFGAAAGAAGLLTGAAAQVGVQIWRLYTTGTKWVTPRLLDARFAVVIQAAWPVLAAMSLTHVLFFAGQRALASDLPTGAFAVTNYAQRLLSIVSLLTMAVYTVAATDFAHQFHRSGLDALRTRALGHLEALSFLLAPATVVLATSSRSLVDLAFHRGAYSVTAVSDTGHALALFSLALWPGGVAALLHLLFTSVGRPKLVLVTSICLTLGLPLTVLLKPTTGSMVLPIGFVLGMLAMAGACMIAMPAVLGRGSFKQLAVYATLLSARVSVAMLPVILVLAAWKGAVTARSWLAGAASLPDTILGALVFSAAFLALSHGFNDRGLKTLQRLASSVLPRLRRTFVRERLSGAGE